MITDGLGTTRIITLICISFRAVLTMAARLNEPLNDRSSVSPRDRAVVCARNNIGIKFFSNPRRKYRIFYRYIYIYISLSVLVNEQSLTIYHLSARLRTGTRECFKRLDGCTRVFLRHFSSLTVLLNKEFFNLTFGFETRLWLGFETIIILCKISIDEIIVEWSESSVFPNDVRVFSLLTKNNLATDVQFFQLPIPFAFPFLSP